jgi:hypothetical protein
MDEGYRSGDKVDQVARYMELTELPEGKEAIGGRWTFKLRTDSEGRIMRFKSRLCSKGFTQVEGVDFFRNVCTCGKCAFNSCHTV